MKKLCILILLILTCFKGVYAPNIGLYQKEQKHREFRVITHLNEVLTVKFKEYLKFVEYIPYKKESLENAIHRILVIKAVGLTETGLDLSSYSKLTVKSKVNKAFNKKEQAVGLLQIRPVMFIHLTQELNLCNYNINDRWKGEESINMFIRFQNYYNPTWDMEVASRDWNGGGGMGMNKTSTLKYYKKFYSNYKKLEKEYLIIN